MNKNNRLNNWQALSEIADYLLHEGSSARRAAPGYQVFNPHFRRSNDGFLRRVLVKDKNGTSEIQGTLMYVPATNKNNKNGYKNWQALLEIADFILHEGSGARRDAPGYQVFTPHLRSKDGILRYHLVKDKNGTSEIQGTLMYVPATRDTYTFDTINNENDIDPYFRQHTDANAIRNPKSALKRPTAMMPSLQVNVSKPNNANNGGPSERPLSQTEAKKRMNVLEQNRMDARARQNMLTVLYLIPGVGVNLRNQVGSSFSKRLAKTRP